MEIIIDGWSVLMDDADYHREFVPGRSWHVKAPKGKPYLEWRTTEGGTKKTVKFHRLITNANPDKQVDHINGNSLDNRLENLRLVTSAQNNRNSAPRVGYSSKFRGVGWNRGGWRVRIRVDYQHITVGFFKNEVEAAFAYDLASIKYHGEYGRRNFLPLI